MCHKRLPLPLIPRPSAIPGHITAAGTLHGQPFLRQPVPSLFKWRARCRWRSSVLCFDGLFDSGRMPIVIPGSDSFQSASARNRYRLPAGIVIGIRPESLSPSFRNRYRHRAEYAHPLRVLRIGERQDTDGAFPSESAVPLQDRSPIRGHAAGALNELAKKVL